MGIELMKSKLDKALSLVALGVLGVLHSAHAAPVYEIVNLDNYDLQGTLEGTPNGYALGVNANDELVGIDDGKVQGLGEAAPDRGLARSHESDEDDVLRDVDGEKTSFLIRFMKRYLLKICRGHEISRSGF